MIYSLLSDNIEKMRDMLPVGVSADVVEKKTSIGGKDCCFYFIEGLTDGGTTERILSFLIGIDRKTMEGFDSAGEFADKYFPYTEIGTSDRFDEICSGILSGFTAFFIDGYDSALLADLRNYPSRNVKEPDKEKTLVGARDGFVETIVMNTALIRRRVRDAGLIFEVGKVGIRSKTDIAVGYIKGKADPALVENLKEKIKNIKVESISMGQESVLELIFEKSRINPFPKVKYTERPDVAAANLLEGKIVLIVDNTPSCIILPTYFFDFVQQVEDFYFPPVVGGYIRTIRNLFFFLTLILLPVWLFLINHDDVIPEWLSVVRISNRNSIPVIIQIFILEFAIDGLRIASVNTPDSLSSSLGIIGALILSEFAIDTGWFDTDTILYMSVVAIASFAQPSIELAYAVKFMRLFLLLATQFFGLAGLIGGWLVSVIVLASNKTLGEKSYIYPLYPFNWKDFKKIILRKRLNSDNRED